MRIVASIPHESMTISIFHMNDKYLVKFEAGPMEQIFKFGVAETGSIEDLKKKVDAVFIETTRQRFNDMFMQMRNL